MSDTHNRPREQDERNGVAQEELDCFKSASPKMIRLACRGGEFKVPTCGFAAGHAQANVVILPKGSEE
jgi:uncharacterized protein YcsI (UPF0317 family)